MAAARHPIPLGVPLRRRQPAHLDPMPKGLLMTGPEHYREAERLLDTAVETHDGRPADTNIARAQVHAMLALAAATALNDAEGGMSHRDYDAWAAAAGTPKGGA